MLVVDTKFMSLIEKRFNHGDFANFLNPWGGQYKLYFTNPLTNEQVLFTAIDGKQYDSICLDFVQVLTNLEEQTIIVNVFTNE